MRRVWPALIVPLPFLSLILARNMDGLSRLRAFLLEIASMPVPIISVTLFLSQTSDAEQRDGVLLWIAICLAFGISGLAMILWTRRRPLLPTDELRQQKNDPVVVAGAYRALTMLGISFSMSPFMMGFVSTFTTGRFEMVLVGLPFMAIGLPLSAPTARSLTRRQAELRLLGSTVDLVEAVKTMPGHGP